MAIAEPQAVAPRPKLRWFQYSLRTLLVLMTLVAAGLGIYKWWTIVREQRRLQAFIRSCTELTESQRELFCGWVSDRALWQLLNIVPAAGEQLPSAAAILGPSTGVAILFRQFPRPRAAHFRLWCILA